MGKSKPSAQSSYYVCKLRKPAVGAAATKFRIVRVSIVEAYRGEKAV